MTSQTMTYHFRQRPGPNNALGRIKFLFPNRFDVYLHDTASRNLFEKRVRDFSSGCIRIQKPLELAEYVLRGDPHWTKENITKALKTGGNEQYISIKEPIPVHLMYWTAWVDERGRVQFREDLYGRDEPLNQVLHPG
jgi:murein L,D-transpeptidase YcbB/YkuD